MNPFFSASYREGLYAVSPFFSNHENNGLSVKLKPILYLNDPAVPAGLKMLKFVS